VKLDATKIISVLILSTFVLNLGTAYAHDPMAPEYWPTTFPVGQVYENFNELTADEWFVFIGLTVSVCLLISLPKLFDGEYDKSVSTIMSRGLRVACGGWPKTRHTTLYNNQGEICLRLTFPIG
jgi:hypothetical protein